MKNKVSAFCIMLLCLACLTACGAKQQENGSTLSPDGQTSQSYTVSNNDGLDAPEQEPDIQYDDITYDYFADTYWVAAEFVPSEFPTDSISMPSETWNVDLILYGEYGAKFRSVMFDSYVEGARVYSDCRWSVDEDADELQIGIYDAETLLIGKLKNNQLYIEHNNGMLRLERREKMPANGDEWCPADLVGTWALETHEIEGYGASAKELGMSGSITFFGGYPELTANFVNHQDNGNESSVWNAPVKCVDYGLYEGCYNTSWNVMFELEPNEVAYKIECCATMTDRDTLDVLLMAYCEGEEYPTMCMQTYSWQGEGAVG